jgi:cytochrome c553
MMKGIKEKSILAMISFFTITILFAQPAQFPIENKIIFIQKQRSEVQFPHEKHMLSNFSCKKCHHIYVNGKNILDESQLTKDNPKIKCSSCHLNKKIEDRVKLMDAYHLQCLDCHRQQDQEGKKTGPQICAECHPKKTNTLFNWRITW